MTDDKLTEARSVLEDLLRNSFPNTQFVEVRVQPDRDHDGDEILQVEAFFRGSDDELDSETGYDITLAMWRQLQAIGVHAFPMDTFRNLDEEPRNASS